MSQSQDLVLFCFNMQTTNIGAGLRNLGNTCFFNATLQSLLYAPPLSSNLESKTHSANCRKRNTSEWCAFCEMEKIFAGIKNSRTFSPNNMIDNLRKIFKKFKLGRQQDSHEFLRYLIQGMQESETGKLGKIREDNEKKIKKTLIYEIFGGLMKTCVQCLGCGYKSLTSERYYDFNIECQRANSLLEGISSFFAVDKLEGSNKYLCQKCKQRCNARKRFFLETVPQVATFQLKRFTNSMRKLGKFIMYPMQIDLGKYMQNPRKIVYKLFAVIVHLGGSSFSGHYFAFVRHKNLWYKMDDSYVSKVNNETVASQQAYIVFYQRQSGNQEQKIYKIQETVKQLNLNEEKYSNNNKQEQKEIKDKKEKNQNNRIKTVPAEQNSLNGHTPKLSKSSDIKQPKSTPEVQRHQSNNGKQFQTIQNLLLTKISENQAFKRIVNPQINQAISKAFKEVMIQVSPHKKAQENQMPEQQVELPLLNRRKSKEQLERGLSVGEMMLRTSERIIQLISKLPRNKPRNSAKRSMYNLRKYETTMQKKRKLG